MSFGRWCNYCVFNQFWKCFVSRFCSLVYESTELALDIYLSFTRDNPIFERFSFVFWGFTTSEFLCSPLDLWSTIVKLGALGLSCSPLALWSSMVILALPRATKLVSMEGSTLSVIALLIAS